MRGVAAHEVTRVDVCARLDQYAHTLMVLRVLLHGDLARTVQGRQTVAVRALLPREQAASGVRERARRAVEPSKHTSV